jgi:uncharacterized protein (DUF1800 family)
MSPLTDLITSRLTFGYRFSDPNPPSDDKLPDWISAQLAAPATDDAGVLDRLGRVILPITLTNSDGTQHVENRGLTDMFKSRPELWVLSNSTSTPDPAERRRPTDEVIAARWIRAALSPWQIFEVMVDFWHNHFSVDAFGSSQASAMWPIYDQVIRTNALGNFRTMLGATAKSAAMMYFLNQATSNKRQPNENFAREVMELHSLGIERYLGRTTPPGMAGTGYSDQDVQEAARALTGWTIADGNRKAADGTRPNDGSFIFSLDMHDTGTKTVFTIQFPAGGGRSEGESVLDYLASHVGTAKHIATKLYIRFVGDNPAADDPLLQAMADTFHANVGASNQIALVLQTLLWNAEFWLSGVVPPGSGASTGAKVKTPFELMISTIRATNCEVNPQEPLSNTCAQMGAPMFHWPEPNGMPDVATAWTGTNDMMVRWAAVDRIMTLGNKLLVNGIESLLTSLILWKRVTSPAQSVQLLAPTLLGASVSETTMAALTDYAKSTEVLGGKGAFVDPMLLEIGLRKLIGAIAATSEFQLR